MISRSCRCHSCACWGRGHLGGPRGYSSQGWARHGAGHLAVKGKDGQGRGRIYPEPHRAPLRGLQEGTQQSTRETPGTVGKAAANQSIHHGISASTAQLCRQHGDFHGTHVRVSVLPPLLIVSLHLFMVVNCSLLRLLCYSKCCS